MQTTVAIAVPDVAGSASPWQPSSLVTTTSAGLLRGVAGDVVLLCGSNDSGVPVSVDFQLAAFIGGASQEEMGSAAARLGEFRYVAVIRQRVATLGLTFELVGDDGQGGGGGGGTVDQGNPNAGGGLAWPVVDQDNALVESKILVGAGAPTQATAVTSKAYLGIWNLDASQEINVGPGSASPASGAIPGKGSAVNRYSNPSSVYIYIPVGVRVSVFVWR